MTRLEPGTKLNTVAGDVVVVTDYIGEGGQGDVYRVQTPAGDKALKYYFRHTATAAQRANVEQLVSLDFDDERFLWPEALVSGSETDRFGYVMALRPDGWATIPNLLARQTPGATLRSLYRFGLNLAEAFKVLHSRGLAYRDISWGNAFFRPLTGEALICDNDNAVFANQPAEIGGTIDFMAPELIRGETAPSPITDLHALAVLLFHILVNGHPFHGALEAKEMCLDYDAKRRLYSIDPVFIFDPDDQSNRPVHGLHDGVIDLWQSLPTKLKLLFIRSFGEGIRNPETRVTEGEWSRTLGHMQDRIFRCASCSRSNVFDRVRYDKKGVVGTCWGCKKPLTRPLLLSYGRQDLVLDPETEIFDHHIRQGADHDFTRAIAEMTVHPRKPGRYGLRNIGDVPWTMTRSDRVVVDIRPGETLAVRKNLEFQIGSTTFKLE